MHVLLRWLPIVCVQLQDMSVKVTTEVAEVEASKAPPDAPGQVCATCVRMVGGGVQTWHVITTQQICLLPRCPEYYQFFPTYEVRLD